MTMITNLMITNVGRTSAEAVWEIEDVPFAKLNYFTLSWADQIQEIPAEGYFSLIFFASDGSEPHYTQQPAAVHVQ